MDIFQIFWMDMEDFRSTRFLCEIKWLGQMQNFSFSMDAVGHTKTWPGAMVSLPIFPQATPFHLLSPPPTERIRHYKNHRKSRGVLESGSARAVEGNCEVVSIVFSAAAAALALENRSTFGRKITSPLLSFFIGWMLRSKVLPFVHPMNLGGTTLYSSSINFCSVLDWVAWGQHQHVEILFCLFQTMIQKSR